MPADGIEAQDVVPPRCGCWVAHEPAIPTLAFLGLFACSRPSLPPSVIDCSQVAAGELEAVCGKLGLDALGDGLAHLERFFLRTVLPAIAIGELLTTALVPSDASVSVLRSSHFTHSTVIGSIISGSRAVVVAQLAARPLLTISEIGRAHV